MIIWQICSVFEGRKLVVIKLMGKCYRSLMRPALLYWSKYWGVKKSQEQKMQVADMRILRDEWRGEVSWKDKIRNEQYIRTSVRSIGYWDEHHWGQGKGILVTLVCPCEQGLLRTMLKMTVENGPNLTQEQDMRTAGVMCGIDRISIGDKRVWKVMTRPCHRRDECELLW